MARLVAFPTELTQNAAAFSSSPSCHASSASSPSCPSAQLTPAPACCTPKQSTAISILNSWQQRRHRSSACAVRPLGTRLAGRRGQQRSGGAASGRVCRGLVSGLSDEGTGSSVVGLRLGQQGPLVLPLVLGSFLRDGSGCHHAEQFGPASCRQKGHQRSVCSTRASAGQDSTGARGRIEVAEEDEPRGEAELGIPLVSEQTGGELAVARGGREMASSFAVGDIIGGKYKVRGVLGQGGVATTFVAEGPEGEEVAVKMLSLRTMKGWKELDLFEREARVLKSLNHPGIPRFIDSFQEDLENDRCFFIVQKVARGRSLADLAASGWRVPEDQILGIAKQILSILNYLHSLRPAVVHRDIKPANIVLDESSGQVSLVDFGAVQEAAAVSSFVASTIVGTYGYMAPEQFQNRAVPQSDLFSFAATLLFLLTGQPPSSFPQKRLKIDFLPLLPPSLDPRLRLILTRLLEPAPEDRLQTAQEVLSILEGPVVPANETATAQQQMAVMGGKKRRRAGRPAGTKVELVREGDSLRISIPPAGLTGETLRTGSFAVAWNAFIAFWTASAVSGGAPLLFAAFSIPFWVVGAGLARSVASSITVGVDLSFDRSNFSIRWKVGDLWQHEEKGDVDDLTAARVVVESTQNGEPLTMCEIVEGVKNHCFGGALADPEKKWIVDEINGFLASR